MQKRTNKLDKFIKERYEESISRFNDEIKNATTIQEQLSAYARHAGRLEAIIEGLTIGVK